MLQQTTRRRPNPWKLVIGGAVVLALVAGACGSEEDGAATPVETNGDPSTITEPPDSGAVTSQAPTTEPPIVEAADDEVVRVVDLSDFLFDLTAMDNAPLANIYGPDFLAPAIELAPLSDDQRAAILASDNAAPGFELNIEAVTALDPDVILTAPSMIDFFPSIQQLDERFDVQVIDDDVTWQERSRATAAAIGCEGALDERIAAAEQSIEDLAERVDELGVGGTEVSLLRALDGEVTAFNPPSTISTVIAQAGLTQPAAQLVDQPDDSIQPDYAAQTILSSELLGDHAADFAILANTFDLSSPTAELPPDLPLDLIPVVQTEDTIVTSYFFAGLNSVVGVERIVADANLLLDGIEANQ